MDNISFTIPEVYKDKNVLLKVQDVTKKNTPIQTFRSFALPTIGEYIKIKGIQIELIHLYTLLISCRMSPTIPVKCKADDISKISNFDWRPLSYTGPNVWHFKWDNIDCSITGDANYTVIYLRVHDMTPGVGESVLEKITTHLYEKHKPIVITKKIVVYTLTVNYGQYTWKPYLERPRRSLDTIYIDPTIKNNLIDHIKGFLGASEFYDKYGVTWKLVHLFHGPPGTGKTSTIISIAGYFEYNIAKLTITPDMNSQHLEQIFATIPDKTFVLLEDVDSFFIKRDAKLYGYVCIYINVT
jgi:hypothetical protein